MQVEQWRACASCGSENAPDTSFCWRCLAPFVPVPPLPGVASGSPGPECRPHPFRGRRLRRSRKARHPADGRTRDRLARRGDRRVLRQYLMGSSLSLPDTLTGRERLSDPESQRFERYTADESDRDGIDAEGGVYGSPLTPEFFVILVDAAAAETTDQLFDALVLGFSQAGAVVDEADARSGRRRGSDYRCAGPLRVPRRPSRACGVMTTTSGSSWRCRRISGPHGASCGPCTTPSWTEPRSGASGGDSGGA